MCKNRLMYLASLAGVLIFHTYYTGWFSWYLLMLTVTLPWFSLLCSLAPMLRLRISADMPASCLMGQSAHIRLENAGARRLSPPYRLQSVVYDCMGMSVSRQKISLSGSKTAQLELATHHAGAYRCMLEKGSVYDYLGLFRFPLRLPELGELLVCRRISSRLIRRASPNLRQGATAQSLPAVFPRRTRCAPTTPETPCAISTGNCLQRRTA